MKHDWNFEPDDNECDDCLELERDCICEDPFAPDTLKELWGDE